MSTVYTYSTSNEDIFDTQSTDMSQTQYSYKQINELETTRNLKSDDMFLVTTIKNSGIDNSPEYITNNIKTSDISAYMLDALNLKDLAWKDNIISDDIVGLIPSSKIDGLRALAFKDKIVEDDISG
jgi:hypothetical protein